MKTVLVVLKATAIALGVTILVGITAPLLGIIIKHAVRGTLF